MLFASPDGTSNDCPGVLAEPGRLEARPRGLGMGVGSEVFSPVSLGRKAIGVELKESYFKQATLNMEACKNRFVDDNQLSFV